MRRWLIAIAFALLAVCRADAQLEIVPMDSVLVDSVLADTVLVDTVFADDGLPSDYHPVTVSDVFRHMPDSLMPYLSENNRLDFIDFMDSNMKAEVTNQMGGTSQMTALTDDSLSIRMNEAMRVDMLFLKLDEHVDSIHEVVVFVETFLVDSLYGNSVAKVYTTDWQPVMMDIPWNSAQKKRLSSLGLQNILKWEMDKLNNR